MKFALIGYGKMGKEIEQVIRDTAAGEVILKVTEETADTLTAQNLRQCDVAIEFTQPDAAVANIFRCLDAGVPVVVGTTGWFSRLEEVKAKCNECHGAVFYSPNFSIGVNIFWALSRKLAQLINIQPQYKIHITEIHHTEKKDAPSGTAVKTAEILLEELQRYKQWQLCDESALAAPDVIPVTALRQPQVPGTHTLTVSSGIDQITLTHEAKSRRGFAEGAVLAAKWLVGKKGVFEMKDMLHI
ncbi:MAG: 4-hydroxy-tetrahydrodipicolinate reductase [Chitinophagales bacterium]|nr:4-hydroxy-tetrahydrodipicolinate reductase [Chitinophagales bacterium]